MSLRVNYATMYVGAQLAPETRELDLDWAENVGDVTDRHEFEVPTDDASDAYVGVQAFDVGTYGHEILVNGDPLSGFDLPPNDGWQYWVDTLDDNAELVEGSNAIRISRDADTADAFAVGTVTVHWKQPGDA